MRREITKDLLMLAAVAGLSLAMLFGSHLISRKLELGSDGPGELTADTLEQLTGVALGLLGAAILLWLLCSLLLALLAALSAGLGHRRLGAKFASLLPGFLARLTVAALGGSLILATPANAISPPAHLGQQAASQQAGAAATASAGPEGTARVHPGDLADPGNEARSPEADVPTLLSPGWVPHRISLPLQRLLGGDTRKTQEVVVRPGDTLWSVAARHLSPEATAGDIAESWPQWYAANRELIGANPDRLTVGMVLATPKSQNPHS